MCIFEIYARLIISDFEHLGPDHIPPVELLLNENSLCSAAAVNSLYVPAKNITCTYIYMNMCIYIYLYNIYILIIFACTNISLTLPTNYI